MISGAYHCANIEAGELVFVADREPDQSAAPIEFRQLRYFLAVAEELHFGRAAARTFISQPALSQSIARLEQTLDVQLLVRNRHRVELTEAGVELVQHARRMLAEREEVVRRLRSVARGEAGVLRVGVALHAEHDVSSALTALAGEHPGLVLDRSSAISERLLEEVRDGKIDAALGYPVPTMAASDGVESEVIRRIRNTVLVSEESPLAHRASLTVAELREETFLVNPRELAPGALQGLRTMCGVFGGFDPELLESTLPALPLEAAWRPIVEGSAILVLPETSAATVRAPGLVSVPIEPPPLCEVILAWGARSLSPMLERFIAFMRAFRNDHWQ